MRRSLSIALAALALVVVPVALAAFPGGTGRVVFQSDREGDWELYTMFPDGSDQRPLVDRPGSDEFNPAWAPNGTAVVFQSGQTGAFDIATVNEDGSGFRTVVGGPANDRWPRYCTMEWIVFQRTGADGTSRIFKTRLDGTGLAQLSFGPGTDTEPTCSPDGTRVAFSSTREGPPLGYEIGLDGKGLRKLTTLQALDLDYSPDGTLIAYSSQDPQDGNSEIFTQDLATGATVQRTHTTPGSQNRIPAFTPAFGSSVGFAARAPQLANLTPALYSTLIDDNAPASNRESILATTGTKTADTDPCDQQLALLAARPLGPGPTGNGNNSAANVQPKVICDPSGSTLAITGTSGGEKIVVDKVLREQGFVLVVEVNDQQVAEYPYGQFTDIVVLGGAGPDLVFVEIDVRAEKEVRIDGQGGPDIVNGVLTVEGTAGNNAITLGTDNDGNVEVDIDGTISLFNPLSISRIVVEAKGSDTVRLRDYVLNLPIFIEGGPAYRFRNGMLEVALANRGDQIVFKQEGESLVFQVNRQGVERFPRADVKEIVIKTMGNRDEILVESGLPVRIEAGGGADQVRALGGNATVIGGAGNDTIDVRDGRRDSVNGGPGKDTVVADEQDVVKKAEKVTRR